ncbi:MULTISPECIES: hypothetical protein [Capnocytophaga]|uniref:hypothetical protein n=1 Tax=Capnocytophaga TaxID=1016 RepID=UPI00156260E0|nr:MULTISPECIES: hypothetical protein [Capnocytophaga]
MSATENIYDLARLLEEKAMQLKRKIEDLTSENQRLKEQTISLCNEKEILTKEIILWKEKYEAIKVANGILGSKEEKTKAKQQINALIREIDACIVQLSK